MFRQKRIITSLWFNFNYDLTRYESRVIFFKGIEGIEELLQFLHSLRFKRVDMFVLYK